MQADTGIVVRMLQALRLYALVRVVWACSRWFWQRVRHEHRDELTAYCGMGAAGGFNVYTCARCGRRNPGEDVIRRYAEAYLNR